MIKTVYRQQAYRCLRTLENELSPSLTKVEAIVAERWPEPSEARSRVPVGLRDAIGAVAADAKILLLGTERASALAGFLRDLAPEGQVIQNTALRSIRGAGSDDAAHPGVAPGMIWDLIVDAGDLTSKQRIDAHLSLLPHLRPRGLYLLIDPAQEQTQPHCANCGSALDALHLLSYILNNKGLRTGGLPAMPGVDRQTISSWPAGKLESFVQAAIDRIAITSSGAAVFRSNSDVPVFAADDCPTAADLPWPSRDSQAIEATLASRDYNAASLGQMATVEQRTVATLTAEIQRLDSAVARRNLDIAALEKERHRLGDLLKAERGRFYNRCAGIARMIRTAPAATERGMAGLLLVPLRFLIGIPAIRSFARNMRDRIR